MKLVATFLVFTLNSTNGVKIGLKWHNSSQDSANVVGLARASSDVKKKMLTKILEKILIIGTLIHLIITIFILPDDRSKKVL